MGDRYQILVATHLDKEHLHNHLLINSVSFVDGKKFNDNKKTYYKMREVSDELCRKYGLSIVQNPKGQTPRSLYFAEKNGEPTKYNLMREAIKTAADSAYTTDEFEKVIRSLGYEFRYDPKRKYATIKPIGAKKSVRLYRLGEEYDIPALNEKLEWNRCNKYTSPFRQYCRHVATIYASGHKVKVRVKSRPKKKIGGLKGLYLHYCYLLGYLPKGTKRKPLSPEMREAWRKIDRMTTQIRLISKYELQDLSAVESFVSQIDTSMEAIKAERNKIYNKLRRCTDPEKISELKSQRDDCTNRLKSLRKELKTAQTIIEDNPRIREEIEKEMQMKPLQEELIKPNMRNRKREYER